MATGELDKVKAQEEYDELYQDLSQAESNQEEETAHTLQTTETPEGLFLVKENPETPPDAHCNLIKPIINK